MKKEQKQAKIELALFANQLIANQILTAVIVQKIRVKKLIHILYQLLRKFMKEQMFPKKIMKVKRRILGHVKSVH